MKFITLEEVIQIHDEMINAYGGSLGVRDMGLLISAIEMPKAMMFGEYLHESIFDKAASYLFHIVGNHAFIDGNKRTGAAATLIFLKQNGCKIKYNMSDFEEMVCKVAQSQMNKNEISEFLEGRGLDEKKNSIARQYREAASDEERNKESAEWDHVQ